MIAYFTCICNHYQLPLGQALAERLGADNFRMVFDRPKDDPISQQRIQLGWDIDPPVAPWIVPNPATTDALRTSEIVTLLEQADIALIGALQGVKEERRAIRRRIRAGRLTFFISERFFKVPVRMRDFLNIRKWHYWLSQHVLLNYPCVHYLAISHFCPDDLRFLRACKGRIWKWAYFPATSAQPTEKPLHEKLQLGWCGRMIGWKNVDVVIRMMAALPTSVRTQCHLTLVGGGALEAQLKEMVKALDLSSCVTFRPSMPPDEIARFMRELDVYVFPSDRNEGWGVVLAEAMDKCCAVIACEEAGATLNLVKDAVNGFVVKAGDVDTMVKRVSFLANDRAACRRLGRAAWETMRLWSAEEGATRLVGLINGIRQGETPNGLYADGGLCSNCG